MVYNHGDPKSPKDGVVGPLPNGLFMACKWLVPGYCLKEEKSGHLEDHPSLVNA